MFCRYCGKELPADTKVCTYCKKTLVSDSTLTTNRDSLINAVDESKVAPTSVTNEKAEKENEASTSVPTEKTEGSKPKSIKVIILDIVMVVAVVAIIVGAFLANPVPTIFSNIYDASTISFFQFSKTWADVFGKWNSIESGIYSNQLNYFKIMISCLSVSVVAGLVAVPCLSQTKLKDKKVLNTIVSILGFILFGLSVIGLSVFYYTYYQLYGELGLGVIVILIGIVLIWVTIIITLLVKKFRKN